MNYEEIIPDFETLKQEILDFKRGMTVDDFYFYQLERSQKFEVTLDELCEKHFGTHWRSLEDRFLKLYKEVSANRKTKLKKSIHTLNLYFFGKKLSYNKQYKTEYEYDPDEEPDWKGRIFPISEKKVWTGEYEVRKHGNDNEECFKTAIEISKPEKQNSYLKNWRTVLVSLIDQPWNVFSGRFDTNGHIWKFGEYQTPKKLTIADYTCFLALKNALRSDIFVTTYEQEILIPVSSGIAAKIAFRKTGNYVLEMTGSEHRIFSMTNFSYEEETDYQFEDKTLLHVSGYINSKINVHIPNGYYFVSKNYIVELEFITAPILLNAGVIPLMATSDHASVDLLDDEEEERKRWEEEDY